VIPGHTARGEFVEIDPPHQFFDYLDEARAFVGSG